MQNYDMQDLLTSVEFHTGCEYLAKQYLGGIIDTKQYNYWLAYHSFAFLFLHNYNQTNHLHYQKYLDTR